MICLAALWRHRGDEIALAKMNRTLKIKRCHSNIRIIPIRMDLEGLNDTLTHQRLKPERLRYKMATTSNAHTLEMAAVASR